MNTGPGTGGQQPGHSHTMITVLDADTVTRIAAGEVIERPASVVKELIENAIDAGASSVMVETFTGRGVFFRIRVTDDGCGIPAGEVAVAFQPHATSKIRSLDDLSRTFTLGFRGEALASIAAVSRVTLTTATRGGPPGGSLIRLEGGAITRHGSCGHPSGTTVLVEDLFFNTPARKKFQRSPAAEMALITGILESSALAEPRIAFRLIHNGRVRLSTSGTGGLPAALATIYGPGISRAMIAVKGKKENLEVEGVVSPPMLSRTDPYQVHVSVNGRMVISRAVVNALRNAYGTLLPRDRHPIAVLSIRADPAMLDVNIHPAKRIIRFESEEDLRSVIEETVQEALRKADLAPRSIGGVRVPAWDETAAAAREKGYGRDTDPVQSVREPSPALLRDTATRLRQTCLTGGDDSPSGVFDVLSVIGQFGETYLLASNADGDLALIDQHAAHERVLYEDVTRQMDGVLPSQELLEPVAVPLTPREESAALRLGDALSGEGFTIEGFGQGFCLVRAVPVCLGRKADPEDIREVIAEVLGDDQVQVTGLRERVARIAACRGAIKSGAPCSVEQGNQLLALLARTQNPWTCPHGRPTVVVLPRGKIDGMFRRS